MKKHPLGVFSFCQEPDSRCTGILTLRQKDGSISEVKKVLCYVVTSNGLRETRINRAQLGVVMLKKLRELRQYLLDNPQRIKIKWLERFDDWCDDWLWAILAFLRGRLLMQDMYRPDSALFCIAANVRYRAVKFLLKFWGLSLVARSEYNASLSLHTMLDCLFILSKDYDGSWCLGGQRDGWGQWKHSPIVRYEPVRKRSDQYGESPYRSRRCFVLTLMPVLSLHALASKEAFGDFAKSPIVHPFVGLAYEGVPEAAKPNTACPHAPIPHKVRRRAHGDQKFSQRQRLPGHAKPRR